MYMALLKQMLGLRLNNQVKGYVQLMWTNNHLPIKVNENPLNFSTVKM